MAIYEDRERKMTKPTPQGRHYVENITPYTVFLKYTNQKAVCAETILHAIKPCLEQMRLEGSQVWHFADIGCGSGEITSLVLKSVSADYPGMIIQGTFVEPSTLLLKRTEEVLRLMPQVNLQLINVPVEPTR